MLDQPWKTPLSVQPPISPALVCLSLSRDALLLWCLRGSSQGRTKLGSPPYLARFPLPQLALRKHWLKVLLWPLASEEGLRQLPVQPCIRECRGSRGP
jgi:hypothetical protein